MAGTSLAISALVALCAIDGFILIIAIEPFHTWIANAFLLAPCENRSAFFK